MRKTFLIVHKDFCHLRFEILFTMGMLTLYALTDHYLWQQGVNFFPHAMDLAIWIQILLGLGWAFLVSRAIHDESLVGNRQFWITRPYGWGRLLAAKLLFIFLVVLLPLFVADCFLLHQAHVLHVGVLPRLMEKILLIALMFGLPVFALASVTNSINRMLLAILGLAVYIGLVAYAHSGLLHINMENHAPHASGWDFFFAIVLLVLPPALVIVLQYARRATRISVTVLILTVLSITVIEIAFADSRHAQGFSRLGRRQAVPFKAAIDTSKIVPLTHPDGSPFACGEDAPCLDGRLPIKLTGLAKGHLLRIDALSIVASDATGKRIETRWSRPLEEATWVKDQFRAGSDDSQYLSVFAGNTKDLLPVRNITVIMAVTEYAPGTPVPVAGANQFVTQDHGFCDGTSGHLRCNFPVREPDETTSVHWRLQQNCGVTAAGDTEEFYQFGDSTPDDYLGSEFFGPVASRDLGFALRKAKFSGDTDRRLCPGSPVTFTSHPVLRRIFIPITFKNVDIRPLQSFRRDGSKEHSE